MHTLIKPAASVFLLLGSFFSIDHWTSNSKADRTAVATATTTAPANSNSKVQVALLLDVSNSMDGLIDQAKAQLWNMVSVLGKAKDGTANPAIEIALYEYGRPANGGKTGFIKQINAFTGDLDKVSQNLFNLRTDGGDEYCGQVIYTSLSDLTWDSSATNYKVIFIAGNEDFQQGTVTYTRACNEARKKGVIVNTIYCGDRMQGIREHWNLAGECGNGSYTNINQDATIEDIPTPFDSTLFVLNDALNDTYLSYGAAGASSKLQQESVDRQNYSLNKSVAAGRVAVKSKKQLYNNANWDLVDAYAQDSTVVSKVDMKTLPAEMKNASREEVLKEVKAKSAARGNLQKRIQQVSQQRQAYIEKVKAGKNGNQPTLESEIEKIIREQAKRFNLVIEAK